MKKLRKKDFDTKTPEEKIEILDEIIQKNDKKIKFREEFIKFSPLWCKIHLLIPAITLIGTITSCIIPVPGFLESVYSYIFYAWVYSIAIIGTCSIIIPTRLVMSKTLKNLKNKNENMKETRKQVSLSKIKTGEQQIKLLETERPKQEKTWDDVMYTEEEIKQYMQMPESPAPFNPETIFGTDENTEEQTDSLQNEISGPRLVKKLMPPKNKENK